MQTSIDESFNILDKAANKTKAVFISAANHRQNKPFQAASIKENEKIICLHFIVRDGKYLREIAKLAEAKSARVFLDCEQKGAYDGLITDFKLASENCRFNTLKPNEFSAKAVDLLIEAFSDRSKKTKCLLMGFGDLAAKTALFLHFRGAELHFASRNTAKASSLAHYLNMNNKVVNYSELEKVNCKFDFIIGASSGYPIIKKEHLDLLAPNGQLIDAGTGCIDASAITTANLREVRMHSLYSGDLLLSEIDNLLAIEKRYHSMKRKKNLDGSCYIQPGMIGSLGDIIVDNIDHPTHYIAVCDGAGGTLPTELAERYLKQRT